MNGRIVAASALLLAFVAHTCLTMAIGVLILYAEGGLSRNTLASVFGRGWYGHIFLVLLYAAFWMRFKQMVRWGDAADGIEAHIA